MHPKTPHHFNTIAAYHRFMELPTPEHPLVSVVRFEEIRRHPGGDLANTIIHDFYTVALKKNFNGKMMYGQQEFDFDEGVMHLMAPKQVLSLRAASPADFEHTGWLLLIHPDFLWHTSLAKKIRQYAFFNYHVHEALHLSEKEEQLVTGIFEQISAEYHSRIDASSQSVIIAQIELLLTYVERFYQRQFVTRKMANHRVLEQLETFLTDYFESSDLAEQGIPSVQLVADQLNVSANYLSRMLQSLTGQSTKQFIHDKLIALSKEKLSTTQLSVNEIAYSLGFEHTQSFTKLFKQQTNQSPLEFRKSFN